MIHIEPRSAGELGRAASNRVRPQPASVDVAEEHLAIVNHHVLKRDAWGDLRRAGPVRLPQPRAARRKGLRCQTLSGRRDLKPRCRPVRACRRSSRLSPTIPLWRRRKGPRCQRLSGRPEPPRRRSLRACRPPSLRRPQPGPAAEQHLPTEDRQVIGTEPGSAGDLLDAGGHAGGSPAIRIGRFGVLKSRPSNSTSPL